MIVTTYMKRHKILKPQFYHVFDDDIIDFSIILEIFTTRIFIKNPNYSRKIIIFRR